MISHTPDRGQSVEGHESKTIRNSFLLQIVHNQQQFENAFSDDVSSAFID